MSNMIFLFIFKSSLPKLQKEDDFSKRACAQVYMLSKGPPELYFDSSVNSVHLHGWILTGDKSLPFEVRVYHSEDCSVEDNLHSP